MESFDYADWSQQIRRLVTNLSAGARIVFATSCAEQLFPAYVAFSQAERWGDVGVVRGALDLSWEFARGSAVRSERLHEVGHRLERVAPAAGDFRPLLATTALKAVDATNEAVLICADADPKHALIAADDCREAVAQYLYQLSDPSE